MSWWNNRRWWGKNALEKSGNYALKMLVVLTMVMGGAFLIYWLVDPDCRRDELVKCWPFVSAPSFPWFEFDPQIGGKYETAANPTTPPKAQAKAGAEVVVANSAATGSSSSAEKPAAKKPPEKKKAAKKAVPSAMTVSSTHTGKVWRHFGANKAYSDRRAAIADAPRVLREAGYPEPVVALLTEAMQKPGTASHVTNGMTLDFMRSGKSALWRSVAVDFEKPPLKESMEYSAPAEEWSVDWNGVTWTVGIPKVCNNIYGKKAVIRTAIAPQPAKPVVSTECPKGFAFNVNAWSLATLPDGLRKEVVGYIAAARNRDSQGGENLSAYRANDVSNTLGRRLREEVKVRAQIIAGVDIRYVDTDPQTNKLHLRTIGRATMQNGFGVFRFPDDPREHVVEVIYPADFLYPETSGGERRLRVFPGEWGNFCTLNVHGIALP